MTMTFDDVVRSATPAVGAVELHVTEGRSWEFNFPITNDAQTECPDLSGATVDAKVLDAIDGATLVTFTGTITSSDLGNNVVKITAAPGVTVDTAGDGNSSRSCRAYCTLTNGSGRKFDLFGAQDSYVVIHQGG